MTFWFLIYFLHYSLDIISNHRKQKKLNYNVKEQTKIIEYYNSTDSYNFNRRKIPTDQFECEESSKYKPDKVLRVKIENSWYSDRPRTKWSLQKFLYKSSREKCFIFLELAFYKPPYIMSQIYFRRLIEEEVDQWRTIHNFKVRISINKGLYFSDGLDMPTRCQPFAVRTMVSWKKRCILEVVALQGCSQERFRGFLWVPLINVFNYQRNVLKGSSVYTKGNPDTTDIT